MEKIKNLINKYKTFIKYIFSAGISFILDLTLFTIFNSIFKNIFISFAIVISTVLARIISSFINYHINRNSVFKSSSSDHSKIDKSSLIKYIALVIIQMFNSSFLVLALYKLTHFNETLIKIPVECLLFLVNYFIQKHFIFKKKENAKPVKREITKYLNLLKNISIIILAIITSFSLLVKLDPKKVIIFSRHDTDTLLYALVAVGVYFFYKKFLFNQSKRTSFKILSIMFTLLLIFGYSFDVTDSTRLVYGNIGFVAISIIKFIGLYPLIYTILNIIYDYLINLKTKKDIPNKISKLFNEHPFMFTCIILFISYLPYIIAFYPAIMGYDPANQIKEVMGLHTRYMDSVVLLDPNVTITNFNPVLHTLLLGNCFKLGVNIGSVNIGLFLYSIIQVTCTIMCLAYSVSFLKKEDIPNKILYIILAIYIFVPIFPFYSMSTNKDTFFTIAFMLYVIKLYELLKYDFNFKKFIELLLVSFFLFLSRNNGIYTIFLSLPFFLIFKNKRLVTVACLACTLIGYTTYNKVILPYFKITPTSVREVLSIPFQQTAALINNDEDVITEKDRKIISNILDYNALKEKYNPELADPVKNTFNRYYTDENLKEYFNVWTKYLVKRPLIYIDATINNMYGYFYPNTVRWYLYYEYNEKLEEAGFDYHYNGMSRLRNILSGYGNAFQYIPVLSLFVNIGFTVWVYMYLVAALIINKNRKMILILAPALSLILVCVASPANAYFRYAMPYIMTLPLILALLYQNKKVSKSN